MTTRHYPKLNEKDLKLMIRIYEDDPGYFDDPACPYSPDLIDFFKGQSSVHYFDTHTDIKSDIPTDDSILTQITALYNRLDDYWQDVKNSDSASDKNTYFRVSVSLMEKLTTLKEKMSNLKQVNSFMSEVMQIMDEVMDTDQRNEIMVRLERFQNDDNLGENNESTND